MYTVLARKYRSQTFEDVIGQDAAAQTLKNAIESGRVAHAYLFTGTRGVGKTTMARILAKALNCLKADGPTIKPCCKCDSCVNVNTGEDIDVLEIDGASNNGVDQVRELRENAIYRPARSRFKIYIIDEVHMLTVAAFNALLKILEEPPSHIKFIFATTEPNKVLATIQSRCQRFDFRNISAPDIVKQLKMVLKKEKIKFQDDLLIAIAKMANGSMRDALSLLDRLISVGIEPLNTDLLVEYLGQPDTEKVYNLVKAIGDSDGAATLEATDQLLISGLSEIQVVDALIDCLRDLMVLKASGDQTHLVILTEDQRGMAVQLAKTFDTPGLVYQITALEKLRWTVKNSDSPRTLLEAALLRFALSEHFLGVDALMAQLKGQPAPQNKKKLVTKEPSIKTQSPTPTVNAHNINEILAQWTQILDHITAKLGSGTAGLLHNAKPLTFANNILTLQFVSSARHQKEMCESNGRHEQIQQILSECLGVSLKVQFKVLAPDPDQPAPEKADPVAKKKKRNELLNDPAVKTVIMGLDATVTGIEEEQ